MLVIVDSIDRAAVYTDNVPHVAWDLMEVTDKPLTLILPGAHGISHELIPDEGHNRHTCTRPRVLPPDVPYAPDVR